MRIAIIGTGYVGLVTAAGLADAGHSVTCVDTNPVRVDSVNLGRPPFYEPGLEELLACLLAEGRLRATVTLGDAIATADVTFIAVGTPSTDGDIDLSALSAAARDVGRCLRDLGRYHLVVVKSTVVPGTSDTLVRRVLEEASGMTAGSFGLCMNPEFLREGSAVKDFLEPDRIVIGQWDERSGDLLAAVYSSFHCPVIRTSLRNAEMAKYTSNALLATLISFSNEIASLCEATPDTDVDEVLDILHLDRRLSPVVNGETLRPGILSYLRAGCGFGGSCLPKDVLALGQFARRNGIDPRILDAVLAVNAARPARLVSFAEEALGSLRGKDVAVLGLAFKPDSDDLRESPSLTVIELLREKGAAVRAWDPCVKSLDQVPEPRRVALSSSAADALACADAGIIVTAWPEFRALDWSALCARMRHPVIVDGRNLLRGVSLPGSATILSIGRHRPVEFVNS